MRWAFIGDFQHALALLSGGASIRPDGGFDMVLPNAIDIDLGATGRNADLDRIDRVMSWGWPTVTACWYLPFPFLRQQHPT